MARSGDAAELRGLLREELRARLAPAGWSPVDVDSPFELAAFVRSLDSDFAATAEVGCASGIPDRPPVLVTNLHVGVSYEPLRRLSPLLGSEFRLAVLHERLREDDEGGQLAPLEVATAADAARVADELAALMLEHAVAFATPYASLEALLAEVAYEGDSDSGDARFPALLAAAGRFEEARAALARFDPERGDADGTREAKRFARQLDRWIESGGDLALLPHEPPPSRFDRTESKSMSDVWHDLREREKAVKAVRRVRAGKDRSELRSMLETELTRRGLSESPLWFEQTLDQLSESRAEQAQRTAQGLKLLGRIGLGVVKAIRERKLPDLSRPGWVEPPERAVYAIPRSAPGHWTAVQLDADADTWLDRVQAALPGLLGQALGFEIWLDWEINEQKGRRLAAHIGDRQVGTLDAGATTAFTPVMNAAAQRDELPYTKARLTQRPAAGYLLEVQLPAS